MSEFNNYPFWTPRFWNGMRLRSWCALVARNRFRIHPSRWPMAALITAFALFNSSSAIMQSLLLGRRIRRTPVAAPPVFIVGHWRSGTTYLHELMVCDQRFGFPSTYECFAASHFLITEWWASGLLTLVSPRRRPMDNMAAGSKLPQEDEFALVALGAPSPYLRMAFPNEDAPDMDLLDMGQVEPAKLARWRERLDWFVRALSLRHHRPLVFKSPPHTGRVGVLAEMFPGAKFVHISREPTTLYASTMRLWEALDGIQGLQIPTGEGRSEYVLQCFERMYAGYERQRQSLDERHLIEIRYEDLVEDPLGTMRTVYERLELPDFAVAEPAIRASVESRREYRPNRHPELPDDVREQIATRWGDYARRYGYE